MRSISKALLGMALAFGIGNVAATEFADSLSRAPIPDVRRSSGRRHSTGRLYPHSSKRQQARNARQLAAGQIRFIEHGPRKHAAPVPAKTRKPRAKKVVS